MRRFVGIVQQVTQQTQDVVTIYFRLQDDATQFSYRPGQYITIFKSDSQTPEGKAYSLSSYPGETGLSITVKNIGGEFSSYLCSLQAGSRLEFSEAYGYFNPLTTHPIVCLATGVGISPIWSIIKSELAQDSNRKIYIHYSNKTVEDIVFAKELFEYNEKYPNIVLCNYITRQENVPNHMMRGRINLDNCIFMEATAHYLVCGSVDFVRSIRHGLVERGITGERIATEVFFE